MSLRADIKQAMVNLACQEKEIHIDNERAAYILRECINVPEKPVGYEPKFTFKSHKSIVTLVTGGLDSTVMYFMGLKLNFEVIPLYIDFDNAYSLKELNALQKMKIDCIFEDSSFPESFWNKCWKHVIPARNFLCIAIAAEYLPNGGRIELGFTEGEMPNSGGDKSEAFLALVQSYYYNQKITIKTPVDDMTKPDLVNWAKKNIPEELLKTVSCFSEEKGHCGKCQACCRKAMAFAYNGLDLETNTPILEGAKEYIEKYKRVLSKAQEKEDYTKYSKRRCIQDLRSIRILEGKE